MPIIDIVIVTYNPDLSILSRLIELIKNDTREILLIDNSPEPCKLLHTLQVNILAHTPSNGLATAQNLGIKHAFDNNADFVILFDQDSTPPEDYIKSISNLFINSELSNSLAALGPTIYCEFEQRIIKPSIQKAIIGTQEITIIPQIIASGMLISREGYYQVGAFDETLFIDGVDHEWCWRARKAGLYVGVANDITMRHRLGEGRTNLLGFPIKITQPHRLYYQARNIILLSARPYVPLYWKLRNSLNLLLKPLLIILLQDQKKLRLKYFLSGLADGFANLFRK